jgi:hypothetical protein
MTGLTTGIHHVLSPSSHREILDSLSRVGGRAPRLATQEGSVLFSRLVHHQDQLAQWENKDRFGPLRAQGPTIPITLQDFS